MTSVPLLAVAALLAGADLELVALIPGIESAVLRADRATLEEQARTLRHGLQESSPADLPLRRYTLAYVTWRLSFLRPGDRREEKETLLKEAERELKSSIEAHPANAEAHALLGSVLGAQITSVWKGITLGSKSSRSLDRALELAPENPRVALLRGIANHFKPGTFGGGPGRALVELRRARGLFAEESGVAWPNWGRLDAFAWLGVVLARKRDFAGARAVYEEALALEPNHVWIRDVLLPSLPVPTQD